MQSKQSHTPTTPAHVEDDPCDDWITIGSAAQRIIDTYAPDVDQQVEDAAEAALFVATFTRFMGGKR